ncbi:MAG TPA: hypothetical protein VJV58_05235, partial [Bradyrhizobium sp.]|uniref:hypothetical protein n=1 Tax=Bradyrhizobium sp. TaxID=376 RepID=UPI002B47F97C
DRSERHRYVSPRATPSRSIGYRRIASARQMRACDPRVDAASKFNEDRSAAFYGRAGESNETVTFGYPRERLF